jgi:hypothetical protein
MNLLGKVIAFFRKKPKIAVCKSSIDKDYINKKWKKLETCPIWIIAQIIKKIPHGNDLEPALAFSNKTIYDRFKGLLKPWVLRQWEQYDKNNADLYTEEEGYKSKQYIINHFFPPELLRD